MRVLVTGGAGFIGSHLVDALMQKGCEVRVADNLFSGKLENLAHHGKSVEFCEGDVSDLGFCKQVCIGVDRVWHLAAVGSVPRSVNDPLTSHAANLTGTLNMLIAARDAGARRFVYSSSSSVYGANPQLPREETQHPMPVSPYANTKMAAETYVRQFAWLYGLETVVLRYFNIYGPRQDPNSQYAAVVPRFISALLKGERPVVYGDGEQSREFTYVADCVRCTLAAAFVEGEGILGEHFNVAAGSPVTVNRLLQTVQTVMGTNISATYEPPRAGDVKYSDAKIDKAVERLGFKPKWMLEDGIRATAEWFSSNL